MICHREFDSILFSFVALVLLYVSVLPSTVCVHMLGQWSWIWHSANLKPRQKTNLQNVDVAAKKLQIQENVVIWFKSQASPKSVFPQNGDLSCHNDSSRRPRFTHVFTFWLWSSSRSTSAQQSVVSSYCRTSRGRRKADLSSYSKCLWNSVILRAKKSWVRAEKTQNHVLSFHSDLDLWVEGAVGADTEDISSLIRHSWETESTRAGCTDKTGKT